MANSPPSSVKSEPTGSLYPGYESNFSFESVYDNSIDNTLPMQTDLIPQASSSILIDAPTVPSDETPFDNFQGYSAPTLPVYINMGTNEHADDVRFGGQNPSTPEPPISRSLAVTDDEHRIPSASQRHNHPHHFPHHSQNRNRYPYLQRQISTRALNATQAPRTSLDSIPHYEQRPAFRRSYFALRRPRIPKAPPMPKHLYPGYRQNRTAIATTENSEDYIEEEEDDGNFREYYF